MFFDDPISKEIQDYREKMNRELEKLSEKNQELLTEILTAFRIIKVDTNYNVNGRYEKLKKMLWTKDTKDLTSIFTGDEFLVLVALLGNEWASKFKKAWDRCALYPYARGMMRRPFRMPSAQYVYLDFVIYKLNEMVSLVMHHFSFEGYFTNYTEDIFRRDGVISDLIAVEIDDGNDKILESIDCVIHGENNASVITRTLIKGMLMSHNHKMHQWVGDLLLAAKLQEGLRQTIIEVMDEGSKEGFLFLLKLILDDDLIRFSSVVRGLDVWTGLGIAAEKPLVVKECIETGCKVLDDKNYVEEALDSKDALIIYMALWAVAFDDIKQVEDKLKRLLTGKAKYKKLVALYFLTQTQMPLMQHRLAKPLLEDEDMEVKCWVIYNLYIKATSIVYDGGEELFDKLKDILDGLPKKGLTFNESIFPWQEAVLSADQVIQKILFAIQEDMSRDKNIADAHIDIMIDYIDRMSVDNRYDFIYYCLVSPKTEKQKLALIRLMGDKSPHIRSKVQGLVKRLTLSETEYQMIEELLKYKAGDLRKNAIAVLLDQRPEELLKTIKRLAEDKDENKHLAAIDMISVIENKDKFKDIIKECKNITLIIANTSQKTKQLSKKVIDTQMPSYTLENGFGLYDPKKELKLKEIECSKDFSYHDILCSSLEDIEKILVSLSKIFIENKDFEYETVDFYGITKKVVLGNERWITPIKHDEGGQLGIDDYPLANLWKEEVKKLKLTASKILEIMFYDSSFNRIRGAEKWYHEVMQPFFKVKIQDYKDMVGKIPFFAQVYSMLSVLLEEFSKEEKFWIALNMSHSIYKVIPKDKLIANAQPIVFWHYVMERSIYDDKSFTNFFTMEYAYYKAAKYMWSIRLKIEDFERAFELGLVDENELYLEMCERLLSAENLRHMTGDFKGEEVLRCKKLREIANKVAERIITIEARRGDMATPVSRLAANIQKCEGIHIFVSIVVALEKETYVRGYNFVNGDSTKKQILSHLLKCCYPKEGEDENVLRELLKNVKVSEKQLVDAAMYAPQWLDIVEKYLGWAGLKMACWYFHAHINDYFSNEKKAMVSKFSPIEAEDLQNGAFDIDWFHEAYTALGKERFNLVYDSAKYIAGGSLHKRSQLFADAVLGKLNSEKAKEIIKEKRNKDYVLCYGLIPLSNDKKEVLNRFEFLHQFIKESNQFGALRRASEQKAGAIALYNLARNAGFSDIHRFTWYMETEKMHTIRTFLQPKAIHDVMIQLNIDENGEAKIKITKEGKELKTVPATLKNDDFIKEMKEISKSLKDQRIRARRSLEKAMELEETFSVDELTNLSLNPVIEPLLRNLVFISGDKSGYLKEGTLVDYFGNEFKLSLDDTCIIAHPVHLYKKGIWAAYQKDIFDRSIVQPFKQVFRELYKPNVDELENRKLSYRYAGHQIQPKRSMALLKTRGWVLNDYEGFQKIYYKENIIAELISRADWFSPADIEAPTIEYVLFENRKTGEIMSFEDIPECIFSEVMRDIDLVVSVAHVGGVDLEASLSTVEMRIVLISEMLRLLKITNVSIKGSHAFIKGTHGEYTVHLGSGVVHKMATGAINILAIHSGHRGKIFLPFMDEDPRTAEIISKIVFLAEDKKIKDPIILDQIT